MKKRIWQLIGYWIDRIEKGSILEVQYEGKKFQVVSDPVYDSNKGQTEFEIRLLDTIPIHK